MESKSIFTSKTFWANGLAFLALIIQGATGKIIISLELQGMILAGVNIILRMVTKSPVNWN